MTQPPLVLLVDDEPDFRDILAAKLTPLGMRIEIASDGKEGFEKAKTLKPDLILLDVKMPVMDGLDTLAKLKEDPETKGIKVVFLTVFGDPKVEFQAVDRQMSQEMGATDYIKKTDNLESIVNKVKTYLPS